MLRVYVLSKKGLIVGKPKFGEISLFLQKHHPKMPFLFFWRHPLGKENLNVLELKYKVWVTIFLENWSRYYFMKTYSYCTDHQNHWIPEHKIHLHKNKKRLIENVRNIFLSTSQDEFGEICILVRKLIKNYIFPQYVCHI